MFGLKQNSLSAKVIKAMSVFSGVQVINILCSIVRTKLVAVWLGATGMGIFALYNSAIEMISAFTRLELRSSAVRDIAASGSRLAEVCVIVRRWAWMLGIMGAMLTLILSPWLSEWTFGDDEHAAGFMILSVGIMLYSVTDGENAILQGTSMLRRLAKASMIGSVVSILVSIPLYYYLRIDSIVPAILSYFVVMLIVTFCFRRKPDRPKKRVTIAESIKGGRDMIVLGVYMSISIFVGLLASYIFMAYLNHTSETSTIGYYQAGYSLVNRYVGVIFTAITMEYYPRLSRVESSKWRSSVFVSHEMKLVLWMLIPIIAIFISADNLIVKLLYSSEFEVIIPYISCAVIGTVFRAVSWCMAFVILARGDGRLFLLTETSSAIISVGLNIVFYEQWGLTGLGVSYVVWYLSYALIVWLVYRYKYNLKLGHGIGKLIAFAFAMGLMSLFLSNYVGWWATAILAAIGTIFALKRILLNRRRSLPTA